MDGTVHRGLYSSQSIKSEKNCPTDVLTGHEMEASPQLRALFPGVSSLHPRLAIMNICNSVINVITSKCC